MSVSQSSATPVVVPSPAAPLQLADSVNGLRALSTDIQTFTVRYDELRNHLDSIQKSINLLAESVNGVRALSTDIQTFTVRYDELQNPLDSIQKSINLLAEGKSAGNEFDDNQNSIIPESPLPTSPKPNPSPNSSDRPELEILCESMSGKGLRRYIVLNLNSLSKLREEVPKALTLSPNPAKLVLEVVGKFYLQGSRAFFKDSPMISGRQASILVLELYLLSDCGKEVVDEVKAEAESAACAWRKRLLLEGGLSKASQVDARGLVLFIGCFGIPNAFRREDVVHLILLSHPREIVDALKRSCYIFPRVSDWIPKMIKGGVKVKAVNLAYTFGLDSEFQPHDILTQHLKESKESCDRKKREASAFPQRAMEATEKHLAALKSIVECLEYHGINPSTFLPNWQISEMIGNTEKELVHYQEKVKAKELRKRQDEEIESRQKRLRYTSETSLIPGQLTGIHDGRSAVAHVDHYSSYDLSSRYVRSYSEIRDEIVVDKFGQIINLRNQPYGWKIVNAPYDERLGAAQALAGNYIVADSKYSLFGASSLEGFPGLQVNPSATAATLTSIPNRYQFADSVEGQSLYGSSSQQPGAAIAATLASVPNRYQFADSVEGQSLYGGSSQHPGAATAATLTSVPNRYQFADSVEGQSHYGSSSQQPGAATAAHPPLIPDQHTAYYYQ